MALIFFTLEMIVLNNEIDKEVQEVESVGFFFKAFLQAFRTSIGELGTPKYEDSIPNQDTVKGKLNVYLIWIIWYFMCFFDLVVMLNFIIAVISEAYDKM